MEADVRRFAVDEKRCCTFWGFAVTVDEGITLRWDGPPGAGPLIDRLHAYFDGDQPIDAMAGLL